jgi:Na+-transporting NADH:ubiquinone oxidoreductase subunit C
MKKDSPAYVLGFIVALTVVFGAGVSVAHYATRGMLARNEQLHRNRVLVEAFGLPVHGDNPEAYAEAVAEYLNTKQRTTDDASPARTFRVYTEGSTGRVGFVFAGQGFWDRITGVIVLDSTLSTVTNIRFLEQSETPGLGARIEELAFTGQFRGLALDWEAEDGRIVAIGPAGSGETDNRVDAITGATQTSQALMEILNTELKLFAVAYAEARP